MSGRRAGAQAGIALLLVVWLLAVLAVLAGEFIFSTRVKAAAERNQRDGLAAYALALAGYRSALAQLAGEIRSVRADDDGRLLLTLRGDAEEVVAAGKDLALGEGTFSWRVEAEDGRVNLNAVNAGSRATLTSLLGEVGLEPGVDRDTIADSILDWVDDQKGHRLNGAEEDFYRGLDPPYSCKDGPFDVPEELLLVRGMKPRHFFGGEEGGKTYPGLRDLVTVCPTSLNLAVAPKAVLEALGKARPAKAVALAEESWFRVTATGRAGEGGPERTVVAVVRRSGAAGDRIEFGLVYWNDQQIPE